MKTQPEENKNETSLKAAIYPNPTSGQDISVTFTTKVPGPVIISLYETNGRCLYIQEVQGPENEPVIIQLPFNDFRPGIYVAEIRTAGERVIKKVVNLEL